MRPWCWGVLWGEKGRRKGIGKDNNVVVAGTEENHQMDSMGKFQMKSDLGKSALVQEFVWMLERTEGNWKSEVLTW